MSDRTFLVLIFLGAGSVYFLVVWYFVSATGGIG